MDRAELQKQSLELFEEYYTLNGFDKLETLKAIERDIGVFKAFKKHFPSYTEFLDALDLSEDEFLEASCERWFQYFNVDKGRKIDSIRESLGLGKMENNNQ